VTRARWKPGLLARAERTGEIVENTALAGVLTAMILLASAQIVLRNFFGSGIAWGDEALRLMVLWVAMLGAVAASRENRHLAIDALLRVLPAGPRAWAEILVRAFTSAVAFSLAWFSWQFLGDSREFGDTLLNNLPAWWFQSILPVGFFLIGYRYAIWVVRSVRSLGARSSGGEERR